MKKYILAWFIISSVWILNAQDYYYYYDNQKTALTLNTEYVNIVVNENFKESTISKGEGNKLKSVSTLFQSDSKNAKKIVKIEFTSKLSDKDYLEYINMLKSSSNIYSIAPYFERGDNRPPIGTSNIFYVKLKNVEDLDLLKAMAKKNDVEIVKEVSYMPNWYILAANSFKFGTSVDLSNQFYETDFIEKVDPAFMFDFTSNRSNGSLFDNSAAGVINRNDSACTNDPIYGIMDKN